VALIRLPKHQIQTLKKIDTTQQSIGKTESPSLLKLAKGLEMVHEKLHDLLNRPRACVSLETLDDKNPWLKETRIPSPLKAVLIEERDTLLEAALKRLDRRERKMIRMRFGLSKENEHTLEQIGSHFDLSRERVRQIEKVALGTMKKALYRAGYGP
jgi:RNA polymerase primary sigma factor